MLGRQITKSSFWHRHQRIHVQMHPTTARGPFPESENRILICMQLSQDEYFKYGSATIECVSYREGTAEQILYEVTLCQCT